MNATIIFILPPLIIGFLIEVFKQRRSQSLKDLMRLGKRMWVGTLSYAVILELYFLKTDSQFRDSISTQQIILEITVLSIVFLIISYVGVIVAVTIRELIAVSRHKKLI